MAGLSVSKALCARARAHREAQSGDFDSIERSILEIEKQARGFDEITRSAETIRNGSEKILERVRIMGDAVGKQIAVLTAKVADLKSLSTTEGGR